MSTLSIKTLLDKALATDIMSHQDSPFEPHLTEGQANALIITGGNASGKSLLFQVLAAQAHQDKVLPLTISIRERTGAGTSDMAGMRRMMMFGDESKQSTGATSLATVRKAFVNAKGYAQEGRQVLLMLDEPEQGLSEDYASAMGQWLAQQLEDLDHPNIVGAVVVTHSRALVRALASSLPLPLAFVSMDKAQTLAQWVDDASPKTVEDLEALEELAKVNRRAAMSILNGNKDTPRAPRP